MYLIGASADVGESLVESSRWNLMFQSKSEAQEKRERVRSEKGKVNQLE